MSMFNNPEGFLHEKVKNKIYDENLFFEGLSEAFLSTLYAFRIKLINQFYLDKTN